MSNSSTMCNNQHPLTPANRSSLRRIYIPAVIAAITIIATSLAGCSSSKKAGHQQAGEPIPTDAALQTPRQRYDALCAAYGDWQDVSMPVRISLNEPKKVSFQAKATMKRNRWINFSVRLFGFELASVFVDTDSVYMASTSTTNSTSLKAFRNLSAAPTSPLATYRTSCWGGDS